MSGKQFDGSRGSASILSVAPLPLSLTTSTRVPWREHVNIEFLASSPPYPEYCYIFGLGVG